MWHLPTSLPPYTSPPPIGRITRRQLALAKHPVILEDVILHPGWVSLQRCNYPNAPRHLVCEMLKDIEDVRMDGLLHHDRVSLEIAHHHREADSLAIIPDIPFTGLGAMIQDDGFAAKLVSGFLLGRLQWIRQLGFLTIHARSADGQTLAFPHHYEHTRYTHSLIAYILATVVAHNAGFDEKRSRTLRAAALLHDAATPAGGDTTKLAIPGMFDEEENFAGFLLRHPRGVEVLRAYGVNPEEVIEAVHERGVTGRCLNIIDRPSYVSPDTENILSWNFPRGDIYAIEKIVRQYPEFCSLWEDVAIAEDGYPYLMDAAALERFLKVRLYLFRGVYWNAWARFIEFLAAKVMIEHLVRTESLTKHDLLTMEDFALERRFEEFLGGPRSLFTFGWSGIPQCEKFRTWEEAQERERMLLAERPLLSVIEPFGNGIKTGTKIRTQIRGKVMPFQDAFPKAARALERRAHFTHPYWLLYMDMPEGTPHGLIELLEARRERLRAS